MGRIWRAQVTVTILPPSMARKQCSFAVAIGKMAIPAQSGLSESSFDRDTEPTIQKHAKTTDVHMFSCMIMKIHVVG